MELQAKVTKILPIETGKSKNGNDWSKARVIVETLGQYPKNVELTNFKRCDEFAKLTIGAVYNFSIDIESREYNGRWYTTITAWSWTAEQTEQTFGTQPPVDKPTFDEPTNSPKEDALPF